MRVSRPITARNRADLVQLVKDAPEGAVLELVSDPRTLAQNRLMWAMLEDVADQLRHAGEKWEADEWRCAFMKAVMKERGLKMRWMPALDGDGVVMLGYRTSKLDKEEFSELIETIHEYGSRNGVVFK
jgi:hypothetical protein